MPLDSGHKAMCPSSECHLAPPSPPSNKDIPATLLPDGPESPTDAHHEFLSERMHYLCARSSHDHLPIGASFSYNTCISKANIHKDHVCPLNECFTRVNGKRAVLWSNQHFGRCHHGKKPKDFLYVLQYFRRDRFVSAQDLDGTWWDCDYSAEAANAEYITCDGCSVSYP
ncbi:hypothetical protein MJO29_012816 [Puccinia striiformis f. sp. tritici]|uniref:uncharacterized protein n=1 Tax=Puccinia striiformis f. sp. tritici TaxID=168172 RepID=UPI002008862D|nr:uncharacterized protein Pst134EA_031568 [Puccinia striiformis f. sp. tritici]XP_047796983.1 uncharacterized protein Pst134EA_032028 [Puccinia striiformis f. sp. tritici]XP_047800599.1 hypothetical protein Pst134EA_024267 [Puccinia striiformis f. sp. tritici]KAH9442751.1 hypothetical protein Pst134EA_031568 [Puccinia striiformis f. sp. tritici]KAH9444364.1 hypothetical protein Pst134EA_032028 [Puccinia striiformis f. sp. tritici]KAH9444699.1 hypothetical protein Pst134EB_024955 [Puccinia str